MAHSHPAKSNRRRPVITSLLGRRQSPPARRIAGGFRVPRVHTQRLRNSQGGPGRKRGGKRPRGTLSRVCSGSR
jgi:hypothetical protein